MPKRDVTDSGPVKRVALFRNGRNQAIRIPKEYEFPGKEALLFQEGDRLILSPLVEKKSLLEVLDSLGPLKESFPDVDEGLGKLDEVSL